MLNDFIQLVYPRLCLVCQNSLIKGEKSICLNCENKLPKHDNFDNPDVLSSVFWGRVDICNVLSFLRFEKGNMVQKIMFEIKYKGGKDLGETLGKWFARELKQSADWLNFDLIVPIPLHFKKLRRRGYNQSEAIGNGLSEGLNVKLDGRLLKRLNYTNSQTAKTRYERWQNIKGSFRLTSTSSIADKHILLVDDVLTTGSTLEAAAIEILKAPGTSVSIATLAYTV